MNADTRAQGGRLIIAVLLCVLGATAALARSADASPSLLSIRGVSITNVTDTSFTVSWVTDSALPGSGSVDYGTSPTSLVFQAAETSPVAGARGDVHAVTVRSLSASTTYYFSVVDAGVSDPSSGYVYKVTTGPSIQGVPTVHWATGQVFQSDGKTLAVGVLVTVRVLDNANLNGPSPTTSAPQSGFTNSQGYWTIALNPRTSDSSSAFNYSTNGSDFLLVTAEGGGLGAVYPAQSDAIKLDNGGVIQASAITLGGGVNPAETPIPVGASVTATATPTVPPASTVVATITPRATLSPAGTNSPTPRAAVAAETPTPTRTAIVIPTIAIPTRVLPPVAFTVEPPPSPTRTEARPTDTPASTRPPSGADQPLTGQAPIGPIAQSRPSGTRTVRPSAPTRTTTATATPAVSAGGDREAAPAPPGPLQSLTLLVSGGLALVGLGLAMAVIGVVDQRRDG